MKDYKNREQIIVDSFKCNDIVPLIDLHNLTGMSYNTLRKVLEKLDYVIEKRMTHVTRKVFIVKKRTP